jgi:hypothetical protein
VEGRGANESELPANDRYEDVERAEFAHGVSDETVDVGARSDIVREGESLDTGCGASAAASFARCRSMSTTATALPAAASARVIARPMPPPPSPTTSVPFPSSCRPHVAILQTVSDALDATTCCGDTACPQEH